MSEMVERVAQAMYVARYHEVKATGCEWPPNFDTSQYRETYLRQARVAIAAMREPTDAMLIPIANEMGGNELCDNCPPEGLADVWRAMVDAALK